MVAATTKFDSFIMLANLLYHSIGIEPYHKPNLNKYFQKFLNSLFAIQMLNMNFVLVSEVIFVVLAMINNNNFVEATMNLSYIGFVFVGDIKIYNILFRKAELTMLMQQLEHMYPKNNAKHQQQQQQAYNLNWFLQRYNAVSGFFVIIHFILIWTYNLYAAVNYLLYDYWLQVRVVELTLPYYCWLPWNWHDHWSYYVLYASQNLAGHTCIAGQLASDLLLCVVVTHVIMHYQYLARSIEAHITDAKSMHSDMEFLKHVIAYHQQILHLSDSMNEVFGIALLVNFLSSSFIMCFLGFQMTIGVQTTFLVMLLMFLFASLVQIYMISNYAQELIIASESIGHAVYNHNWFNADIKYKQMLVLIIKRAQKPAVLKATTFLNISLGTMTSLIQLSYKFYALLRTMYAK